MNIHEYQAKKILKDYGAPVSGGAVILSKKEIKEKIKSLNSKEFVVNNNDRVAQMVLMPVLKIDFEEVNELPETIRGSGGFGSTGK